MYSIDGEYHRFSDFRKLNKLFFRVSDVGFRGEKLLFQVHKLFVTMIEAALRIYMSSELLHRLITEREAISGACTLRVI